MILCQMVFPCELEHHRVRLSRNAVPFRNIFTAWSEVELLASCSDIRVVHGCLTFKIDSVQEVLFASDGANQFHTEKTHFAPYCVKLTNDLVSRLPSYLTQQQSQEVHYSCTQMAVDLLRSNPVYLSTF